MAYNDRKIRGVLLGELAHVPNRCEGYHDAMKHLLTEVLNLEQEHAIRRMNVVNRIGAEVNTVGMALHNTLRQNES